MNFSSFSALLALFVLRSVRCEENADSSKNVENTKSERADYVINLALFGDADFGKRFNYDSDKILEYWKVLLYDVHLRFQTLTSVNISFQVTLIQTFKTQEDQPFFENTGNENHTYYIPKLAENFQHWVSSLDQVPNFGVAVLLLGRGTHYKKNEAHVLGGNLPCGGKHNEFQNRTPVSIVGLETFTAKRFTLGIAKILGNSCGLTLKSDCRPYTSDSNQCCISESTLLGSTYTRFLSKCLDMMLAEKFANLNPRITSNLDAGNTKQKIIIDSAKLLKNSSEVFSYTMKDHCQIMLDDVSAKPLFGNCEGVACVTSSVFRFSFYLPFENTKCGEKDNGRCVRGSCVNSKNYLANVATNKCLVPENNQFDSDNKPVLRNCSEIPIDLVINTEIDQNMVYVPTMLFYTWTDMKTKTLTLETNSTLRFSGEVDKQNSKWIVNWLENSDQKEFILRHNDTGLCVKAAENGNDVDITRNCSGSDDAARWKLIKIVEKFPSAELMVTDFFEKYGSVSGFFKKMIFEY